MLLIIIILFGLKYGLKNFIKWEKDNINWDNFAKIDSIEGGYDAYILTQIKVQGEPTNSDFEVYALMDPNNSRKITDTLSDNQLLIHEKYHFNITEYYARLFRKEIIAIGKEKLTTDKLKSLHIKYLKLASKTQDEYDKESNHNKIYEKQRYWELKVDDLLRQTEIYSDSKLNNYYTYNPIETNYFRYISLTFHNKVLTSYPINPKNKNLGEVYQLLKYKDSSIIKYYKNGKNINGGYFNTAIFKLINTSKDTIENHYFNSNKTYNKEVNYQIEKFFIKENKDIISFFLDEKSKEVQPKCIWKNIADNTYLGNFYNPKGEKTYNRKGFFGVKKTIDSLGRLSKEEYLNKNGTLILDKENLISGVLYFYNDDHTLKQKKLLNLYGGYAEHKNMFNILYNYDSSGNISKVISLDPDNNLIEDKSGISIYKYWYDSKGNEIQIKRYNRKKVPVLGSEDYFMSVKDYDDKNRISFDAQYYFFNTLKFNEEDKWGATKYEYKGDSIELRYNYDVYNNNFNDDTGIATVKIYLDKDRNSNKVQYLDLKGNFAKTKDNVVQYKYKFDKNGNTIEEITLDSLNRKIPFSEDVSVVKWEYNKNNIKTKTTYYTAEGALANAKQDATYNFFTVNNKNEIEEVKYYDKNMKPVEIDGIFKTKYYVNRFGKDSIIEYYNKQDRLIDGIAMIKYKYNSYGTLIEEAYFNNERKHIRDANGISFLRYLINSRQQNIGHRYFNENFSRINNIHGYHYEKIVLDNYGYVVSEEYFDKRNNPVINKEKGYHKLIYKRDSIGELTGYEQHNTRNKLIEDNSGIAKQVYTRAKSGLTLTIKNYDKNSILTNDSRGVAETYYKSYLNGLYFIDKELDKNGKEIKKE